MLLSIIIPTFNRIKFLPQALNSVWQQTFADFEVIVVDDGSTDGTAAYLNSVADRVQVVSQPNRGPGAARNIGVTRARGEYVAFLDSDDLWFPWTLEVIADVVRQHTGPAIVATKLIEFSAEDTLAAAKRVPAQCKFFSDYFASWRAGCFVGAGMAVLKREEFIKAGGFLEERINAEDHDLILRLGMAPGFVQILQPITLAWRRHDGSETSDVQRSYEGVLRLLAQETTGAYPGAAARSHERQQILTRHVRPLTLQLLRKGKRREAWQLYRRTFQWNGHLGNWKYIVGFPLSSLFATA